MSQKENPYRIRYGTGDGEIKFGHLTEDNEQSAVMLRNFKEIEGKHYITLDQTGSPTRKNGTICRSTGSFQVKAGDAVEEKDEPGIYLEAVSGDIVIAAPSGKIRMQAVDIHMRAEGEDGEKGNIIMDANEKIVLDAQAVNIKAKNAVSIISDKTIDAIARTNYNIYASMIDMVDSVQTSVMQDPGAVISGFMGGSITSHELRMAMRDWVVA
jgi:hypothetical protein